MSRNVIVQHYQRPLAPAEQNSIFYLTQLRMSPRSQRIIKYNLHYDDVRGDVLRLPHGTTSAPVKIKYVLNEDSLEAKNTSEKRK